MLQQSLMTYGLQGLVNERAIARAYRLVSQGLTPKLTLSCDLLVGVNGALWLDDSAWTRLDADTWEVENAPDFGVAIGFIRRERVMGLSLVLRRERCTVRQRPDRDPEILKSTVDVIDGRCTETTKDIYVRAWRQPRPLRKYGAIARSAWWPASPPVKTRNFLDGDMQSEC